MSEPRRAAAPVLLREHAWCTMGDVDAAGIIYFASALRWAERLSTSWFRATGYPYSRLFSEGIATPAVNVTANYFSHVKLDDELQLDLSVSHLGTSSYTFRSEVFVGDDSRPAVDTRITHVYAEYVHPSHAAFGGRTRSRPLPEWLRDALQLGYRADGGIGT